MLSDGDRDRDKDGLGPRRQGARNGRRRDCAPHHRFVRKNRSRPGRAILFLASPHVLSSQETLMSVLTMHSLSSAPDGAKKLLQSTKDGFGWVVNQSAYMAESPE